MKRTILLSFMFLLALVPRLFSQADPAIAAAHKEESEERYKNLTTRLERLEETFQAQHQTIIKLGAEVLALRQQLSTVGNSTRTAASQESLQGLANAIKEVDQKRISDSKTVLKQFNDTVAEIQKILKNRSMPMPMPTPRPATETPTPTPTPRPGPAAGSRGRTTNPTPLPTPLPTPTPGPVLQPNPPSDNSAAHTYVVQAGDTLGTIGARLNKQGIKITRKQIAEANPQIKDWQRIRPGDKITIPDPPRT